MVVDGREDGQPVLHAHAEVVLAVAGSGVDEARAGLGRRVRAHYDRALAVEERMPVAPALQLAPLQAAHNPLGMEQRVSRRARRLPRYRSAPRPSPPSPACCSG